MWIVIADATDVVADWVYAALKSGGLDPLYRVSADDLALCPLLEHTIAGDRVGVRIRFVDGTEVDDGRLRGVVNRLYGATVPHFRAASSEDREYAQQELYALHLSWLYGLRCPVINRPSAQGLSGAWRHEAEWVVMAHQAGLPVATYRQSGWDRIDAMLGQRRLIPEGVIPKTAIVFGALTIGRGVPPEISAGCRRLAALASTELLGVEFVSGAAGPWTFAGATPIPDLRPGGPLLVAALVARLTGRSAFAEGRQP